MEFELEELLDNNFKQLKSLIAAAVSNKYTVGRDNVGMYALPDRHQTSTTLETYEKYGFGDIFNLDLKKEIKRQEDTENSILIRGPLNPCRRAMAANHRSRASGLSRCSSRPRTITVVGLFSTNFCRTSPNMIAPSLKVSQQYR